MQEKIEWKVGKRDCAGQVRGQQQWRESKNTASWSVSQEPHPILSYRRSACSVSSAGVTCARDASLGFGPPRLVPFRHARLLASTLPSFFLCPSLSLYPCFSFEISFLLHYLLLHCIPLAGIIKLNTPLPPHHASCSSEAVSPHTYHVAILSRFSSIMGDALCGPSNALQNFQKHTSVDRTLQQDRLTSRQPSSQVSSWEVRM